MSGENRKTEGRGLEAERRLVLQGAFVKGLDGLKLVRTEGENGLKLLRRLVAADAAKFAEGEAFRAPMLSASGCVMQELRVAVLRNAWEVLFFPGNADAGAAWARQAAVSFDAEVRILEGRAGFWLGGPKAREVLAAAGLEAPREGRFTSVSESSRILGFPGIFLAEGTAKEIGALREKLLQAGASPIGDEAWELARISCGIPEPGAEYDESSSPLECGLGDGVDFSDPSRVFIGRALTEARARAGVRCRLGLLDLKADAEAQDLEADPETEVEGNSEEAGIITSWSRTGDGRVLALALLPASSRAGGAVRVGFQALGRQEEAPGRILRLL